MHLRPDQLTLLHDRAIRVREHIVRMSGDGGCFIGASLSCADILTYLYSNRLRITPETVRFPERDYLFLSKGHDVPALYGVLAECGFIDASRLRNHLSVDDHLYWHPNRAIPGVEFHSGSLGHLLAVAMGVAFDVQIRKGDNRVYVILGDGELNEGSVWEACLVAAAKRLSQLTIIVDRNGFQANMATEELIPLEPLANKFEAFGWQVLEVDGHDFQKLHRVFHVLAARRDRPHAVIAQTVRGRGVTSIEGRADRWFMNVEPRDVDAMLNELHGASAEPIHASPEIVR